MEAPQNKKKDVQTPSQKGYPEATEQGVKEANQNMIKTGNARLFGYDKKTRVVYEKVLLGDDKADGYWYREDANAPKAAITGRLTKTKVDLGLGDRDEPPVPVQNDINEVPIHRSTDIPPVPQSPGFAETVKGTPQSRHVRAESVADSERGIGSGPSSPALSGMFDDVPMPPIASLSMLKKLQAAHSVGTLDSSKNVTPGHKRRVSQTTFASGRSSSLSSAISDIKTDSKPPSRPTTPSPLNPKQPTHHQPVRSAKKTDSYKGTFGSTMSTPKKPSEPTPAAKPAAPSSTEKAAPEGLNVRLDKAFSKLPTKNGTVQLPGRARVSHEDVHNLLGRSMTSQDIWLSDGLIDAAIAQIRYGEPDPHHMIAATVWTSYERSDNDVTRMPPNVRLIRRNLVTPINVDTNHWVLVYVDVGEGTIYFMDSMEVVPRRNMIVDQVVTLLEALHRAQPDVWPAQAWTRSSAVSDQQQNGHDCGIYVIENARGLIHDRMVPRGFENRTHGMRNRLARNLLAGARGRIDDVAEANDYWRAQVQDLLQRIEKDFKINTKNYSIDGLK